MKFTKKYFLFFILLITIFLSPFSIESNLKSNSYSTEIKSEITINLLVANAEKVGSDGFLVCGENWAGIPNIPCVLINFLQTIVVTGGNIIVGLAAFFMDTFLFHSLQSSSYSDSGFIVQGWEILRNLTNIIFIFSLLSLAFKMVLDVGQSNAKKQLVRIILITLTINFSLFFSFAVIDMSNVLAYTFYNKIDQQEVSFNNETNSNAETFKGKSTSIAIAAKINPQRLLGADASSNPNKGQRVVMVLMAGVINGVLIYVFLSVAFLFLGRTIALWLTVVLAPLAFASLTIPGWEKKKYFGFDNWFKSLIETSFMAPVFLFFLYLAVQFMKIDITFAGSGSGAFINNILNIVIPMAAIVVLLLTAKKVANAMSGDFAGTISGIVAKVAGGAVAVGSIAATGGMAAVGRVARGASMIAPKGSKFSKVAQGIGKRAQATNFNFAQSRIGKLASKTTGINMGAELGNLSYARADTKVRKTANTVREGYDNLRKGKTPESVKEWQDNVQESRDQLTQSRIENRQRKAEKEAKGEVVIGINPDGTEVKDAGVSNLDDALKQRQVALARRTSLEAKTEKDKLDKQKQDIQLESDAIQDEIRTLAKIKTKTPADLSAIKSKREEVQALKKRIQKVDETSLTGQITQIKKQIDNEKNTARAGMLKDDKKNRRTTQDSGLTIGGKSRLKRVDNQASRVGSGDIKTTPNVGGDSSVEK